MVLHRKRWRSALTLGSVAAATALACSGSSGGRPSVDAGGAASVYVIDSTERLFSFDAQGNSLGSVAVTTPIGALNGGGIALASGLLYVTVGQPTNAVSAYTLALTPQTLGPGSFSGLGAPRGIAYDSSNDQFYVGSGAASVSVYGAAGAPVAVPGTFPNHYGPSGVAYDPDDGTIWVANYVGSPSAAVPRYGVSEYTESGAVAQSFDYTRQFAPTTPTEEPYAITVCPKSATGGTTLIVVGFTDDGQGGIRSVQPFTTSGAPVGPTLGGDLGGLSALSCDADGNVYIADKLGLFRNRVTSSGFTPGQSASLASPGFAGLEPPIYGVFAGPIPPPVVTADGGPTSDGGADAADAAEAASSSEAGDAGGWTPVPTCTLPTPGENGGAVQIGAGEECVLSPDVTSSMAITASPCGVYDAPQGLQVTGAGTVLTIEQGVTIAFGANQVLQVTGGAGLVVGTQEDAGACAPVVFTSDSPTPSPGIWGQVLLQSPIAAGSSISNLIVQYAGSGNANVTGAGGADSFDVDGTQGDFTLPLANVTLSNNGAVPFYFCGNHTGPGPGSGTLTATDWPAGADAFTIFPDAAGLLSNVRLSTSAGSVGVDAGAKGGTVHLATPGDGSDTIDTTQTWPSILPLAYVLAEPYGPYAINPNGDTGQLNISSSGTPSGGLAVLTIAAPNELLVGSAFTVVVDPGAANSGAIVAQGSASDPITFAPLGPPLGNGGSWPGMLLYYPGSASSILSYVTFNSAGGYYEEGCSVDADGPIYGALDLENSGLCAPPPILSNLTFTSLPAGSWGILPADMANPQTLVGANPKATVYLCPIPSCSP